MILTKLVILSVEGGKLAAYPLSLSHLFFSLCGRLRPMGDE